MKRTLALFALNAACLLSQTAETIPFRAVLLPTNEVPAANIEASGTATLLAHELLLTNANGRTSPGTLAWC